MLDTASKIDNHCPFGCCLADLDEHGYCRHLVGFTNDGKTYEAQIRGPRGLRQVDAIETDTRTGRTRRKVHRLQPGDKLINPVTPQLNMGVWHNASRWVSDRVYRLGVPEEARQDEIVIEDEAPLVVEPWQEQEAPETEMVQV